ncbi:MerR family transcriptional regulator [Thaumasiovibrio subtropicus]|uniref:MerR family transcriptional regulator n=1 Tax=Thaumasiovibrio subtropicus TaxID=1891207 RepID=UPI000B34C1AA|nr:MerR family transcriptional regulator [Thaumasiovibrio subtropicus]
MDSKRYFSIGEVADKTGVNTVTLRAWQRRYGLIKPMRTDKGHRLYTEEDIESIGHILYWLEKGVSIGKVRPLLGSQQEVELNFDVPQEAEDLLLRIRKGDQHRVEALVKEALKLYPLSYFEGKIAAHIDAVLGDSALVSVERAVWRNAVIAVCAALAISLSGKKGVVAIASAQEADHHIWLAALGLRQQGYSVVIVDQIDHFKSLSATSAEQIIVMGRKKLSNQAIQEIAKLDMPVYSKGLISQLHPELTLFNSGADASSLLEKRMTNE